MLPWHLGISKPSPAQPTNLRELSSLLSMRSRVPVPAPERGVTADNVRHNHRQGRVYPEQPAAEASEAILALVATIANFREDHHAEVERRGKGKGGRPHGKGGR